MKKYLCIFIPFAVLVVMTQLCFIIKNTMGFTHSYAFVMFPTYMIMLILWGISVTNRITNKSIRRLFHFEIAVMALWLVIRLIQNEILTDDSMLLRQLGYFLIFPVTAIPLIGLYASMYIGKNDEHRINGRYYILMIPAALIVLLALTNEYNGVIFEPYSGGRYVEFHPNWGIGAVLGWILVFKIIQIMNIAVFNFGKRKNLRRTIIPVVLILMMFAAALPYLFGNFSVSWELMEFSAIEFFIEYSVWESCIVLSLFPVNTEYENVFDHSTVAMRIVDKNGNSIISSQIASDLSNDDFRKLLCSRNFILYDKANNTETHMSTVEDGYVVWTEDVSEINDAIAKIEESNRRLQKESLILQREISIKAEKARVEEKNKLYSQLSKEVNAQVGMLKSLIEQCRTAQDKRGSYRRICLIGTYIKRRSSLRLSTVSNKNADSRELEICLHDMITILRRGGTETFYTDKYMSPMAVEGIVFLFDTTEALLEGLDFNIKELSFVLEKNAVLNISVRSSEDVSELDFDKLKNRDKFDISVEKEGDCFKISADVHEKEIVRDV